MSNYLLELSLIHIALILGYWFFLRKERQYDIMRFYLLGSTLLALTIPLFKLRKLFFNTGEPLAAVPVEVISPDTITITPAADAPISNYDFLIWVYVSISAFFLFRFFGSLFYLLCLERKSSYEKFNDLYIRRVEDIKGSFTFLHWIFLSNEINKNQQEYNAILKHEKAHVSLGHTYDLLFLELFKICFWWLPTVWFINKEIRKIHEYQADAYALKSYAFDQYSSILISATLKSNGLSLASSFHNGLILKRLIAMKQETKKVNPWKIGGLSALSVLLFTVFACTEEKKDGPNPNHRLEDSDTQGQVFTVVEEQPEFEGGMDAFRDYIEDEIKYPLQARQQGVEGRVFIQFVVEKDGSLSNIKAIKGIGAGCENEAVSVIQNASDFRPGKQRGKPVRVRMVVPVTFSLGLGNNDEQNATTGNIMVGEAQVLTNTLKVEVNYRNGEWYGTVYDEEGNALPGANVVVAGTKSGTVSDLDGTFSVKAQASEGLNISFVGYESVRLEGR